MDLITLNQAVQDERFETVRRHCQQAFRADPDNQTLLRLLHAAHRGMSEMRQAIAVLDRIRPENDADRFPLAIMRAEDIATLKNTAFYRVSEEAQRGLTYEQYLDKINALAAEQLAAAESLIRSDDQRALLAAARRKCRIGPDADPEYPPAVTPAPPTVFGTVTGTLRFTDGSPAAGVKVVLGLGSDAANIHIPSVIASGFGHLPPIKRPDTMTGQTDPDGRFTIQRVPAGQHAFVAAGLDDAQFDIATRFVSQGFSVEADRATHLDLTIGDWQSAPPLPPGKISPESLTLDGVTYRKLYEQRLRNVFNFEFPRQLIGFNRPAGATDPDRLLLVGPDSRPVDFQLSNNRIEFFASLGGGAESSYALYEAVTGKPRREEKPSLIREEPDGSLLLDTGPARFRVAGPGSPIGAPPLLAVQGVDRIWRGRGRIRLPEGVSIVGRMTETLECGPVKASVRVQYELTGGHRYALTFTVHRDEAYLLAHEVAPDLAGAAFEFSLQEFAGGRAYLHWTPENRGGMHWHDLPNEERELARLQESIAWWIPPCGFAYAMTAGQMDSQDYLGVFTIRRGDWIDREFHRLAQGPGDDRRELDWPFPEMIGSTISMITANTDAAGEPSFRFKFFDGERHWGLLVSSLDENDGYYKQISAVQHKCSSPRLDAFKDWHLDEQDCVQRPHVVARRENLRHLRQKRNSPAFASIWKRIVEGTKGAATGLRFAIDGDPAAAWQKKQELVREAIVRSRLVLLGRDYSDAYSPVGGRPITPWVEEYDLIAASGVFTPDEERLVRQFFMLMGHLFVEPDFMNWKFNSRNANFEADRVDIVGSIGLVFHGNPDADRFVAHAVELMERSINVYCTPGSGKWYENPACYYLQASRCRTNLAFHLATHQIMDPTRIERMKDFLRWGVLLLTPPAPSRYSVMRDGTGDDEGYRRTTKVRRIPPIGDHAHLGPWVPDHYALMAKLYRESDPAFADLLLWAWQTGGQDGGYFGNAPPVFASLNESDMPRAPEPHLTSRRLEGFGAVFRGHFGQENEFYLLFKQGPGGYRFHRTEGSIILFADGKPLIYDGGEAGETWRHSTLSFYDTHMPMAPGHVERFASLDGLDFCQGVHPVALKPGDPVYLSDKCDHELVELAYKRFDEPNPAISRTVTWIKDEYVILHDELDLDSGVSSHWHLQVVSDQHAGDAASGYVFKGRFGADLQVLLPDQTFASESIDQVPILDVKPHEGGSFSMRHLQVSAPAADRYLAVLRPLSAKRTPVAAQSLLSGSIVCGVHVTGDDIDDRIFFRRNGTTVESDDFAFTGHYGALLRRPTREELVLIGAGSLRSGSLTLESDGPIASMSIANGQAALTLEGIGTVHVTRDEVTSDFQSDGDRRTITIPSPPTAGTAR